MLDDEAARGAVSAEVAMLRMLGGGCTAPIAAYAELNSGRIALRGMVADANGERLLRSAASGSADRPEEVGALLGRQLIRMGANEIVGVGGR